jgi:hypothetical protein
MENPMARMKRLSTRRIHAGEIRDATGSPQAPLYSNTTFAFDSTVDLLDAVEGRRHGNLYTHYGLNPSILSLEGKLASLLGRWYGDPLSVEVAQAMLGRAHAALQASYRRGADGLDCHIQMMIAHYWVGDAIDSDYRNLVVSDRRAIALVELVYGQLLMSKKLKGAMDHLDAGFEHATELVEASEYFSLRERHRLLAHIPLSERPSLPRDLSSLLTEASVIERLKIANSQRRVLAFDPSDTIG